MVISFFISLQGAKKRSMHYNIATMSYHTTISECRMQRGQGLLPQTSFISLTFVRESLSTALNNNDGHHDTSTGSGTTHDTNKTTIQVPSKLEKQAIPVVGEQKKPLAINDDENDWRAEPSEYHPGKRVGPPLFPDFDQCLRRDIAWSLCGVLDEEKLPLLGCWTPFNKLVTSHSSEAIVQEFLPVTPHPPVYPVCKEYLDFLLDVIEELEIPFMYVHSDELVYSM